MKAKVFLGHKWYRVNPEHITSLGYGQYEVIYRGDVFTVEDAAVNLYPAKRETPVRNGKSQKGDMTGTCHKMPIQHYTIETAPPMPTRTKTDSSPFKNLPEPNATEELPVQKMK